MQPLPLFRASALRPLLRYVERTGLRPERVFGAAFAAMQAADGLLPLSEGGRAFEAAAKECGSDLGLQLGGRTRVEALEFGALVRTAGTVHEALGLIVRHGPRFNTGQRFSIAFRGGDVWLHHRLAASLVRGRVQTRDFALSILLGLLRLGAGASWQPTELHLDGPAPAHAEQLAVLAERSTYFRLRLEPGRLPEARARACSIPRGFALPGAQRRRASFAGRRDFPATGDRSAPASRQRRRRGCGRGRGLEPALVPAPPLRGAGQLPRPSSGRSGATPRCACWPTPT